MIFYLFQSVAFQTLEILNSMELDSKLTLKALLVDGGMTKNELLMQTQADFLGMSKNSKLDEESFDQILYTQIT